MAFDANGKVLASAGMDGTAKLWRVERNEGDITITLLHTLEGHTDAVHDVAFSPDGRTLATAGCDGRVGLFDVETGEGELFDAHQGRIADRRVSLGPKLRLGPHLLQALLAPPRPMRHSVAPKTTEQSFALFVVNYTSKHSRHSPFLPCGSNLQIEAETMGMIENFEAMLARGQDSALLRYGLGNEYLKAKAYEKAVEHLAAAVRQDPAYSAAWKLYGKALTGAELYEQAVTAFYRGIEAAEAKGDVQAAKEMRVFRKRAEKALAGPPA